MSDKMVQQLTGDLANARRYSITSNSEIAAKLVDAGWLKLSDETVKWIELAMKNYSPLTASTKQNSPAQLACYAIHNQLCGGPHA